MRPPNDDSPTLLLRNMVYTRSFNALRYDDLMPAHRIFPADLGNICPTAMIPNLVTGKWLRNSLNFDVGHNPVPLNILLWESSLPLKKWPWNVLGTLW